jgi:GNAT superfamily N-acetyltransferase
MSDATTHAGNAAAQVVRFAGPADVEFVSRENYIAHVGGPVPVRQFLERGQVILAERGGTPVGYAFSDYLCVIDPFLAMIWVAAPHRRQGVGAALLRFLEGHLRDRGYALLYSSARVDQPGPQAWHRRMGFEECGFLTGRGPGGVGEVFFRKPLGEDEE